MGQVVILNHQASVFHFFSQAEDTSDIFLTKIVHFTKNSETKTILLDHALCILSGI